MTAIVSADLHINYTTSGSGNTVQTVASASLGPHCSSSDVAAGANGLFADVSSNDNINKIPHYKVIGIFNNTASGNALQNAVFYFSGSAPAPAFATAIVDSAAAAAIGTATMALNGGAAISEVPQSSGFTTTPFSGGTFAALGTASGPLTYPGGLTLGNIAPGLVKFVIVRLEPQNTSAGVDVLSLEVDGDTAP